MNNTYLTTSTVKDWIHLFTEPKLVEIVIGSLRYLIDKKRLELHAYVIMPNHIHLISTHGEDYPLSAWARDFHKFTAQKILLKMKNLRHPELPRLASRLSDREFQVWLETHAPKSVVSTKFALQKVNYIHNNPVAAKRGLCERPEHCAYSSARDYLLNVPGGLPLKKLEF